MTQSLRALPRRRGRVGPRRRPRPDRHRHEPRPRDSESLARIPRARLLRRPGATAKRTSFPTPRRKRSPRPAERRGQGARAPVPRLRAGEHAECRLIRAEATTIAESGERTRISRVTRLPLRWIKPRKKSSTPSTMFAAGGRARSRPHRQARRGAHLPLQGSAPQHQKITEFVPGKKVVWHMRGCRINFVKDKTEWNGTDVVFEIARKGNKTELRFTHVGLVPAIECYGDARTPGVLYQRQPAQPDHDGQRRPQRA